MANLMSDTSENFLLIKSKIIDYNIIVYNLTRRTVWICRKRCIIGISKPKRGVMSYKSKV